MRGSPIQAVIFDNNGTLLDDLKFNFGSITEIFGRYNMTPPTLEQYRHEASAKYMDFYYNHGFKVNFSGEGIEGDAKALNLIRKEYYRKYSDGAHFRPDAIRTIKELKKNNIKVGIVSAEIEEILLGKLDKEGVRALFKPGAIKAGVYGDKTPALLEVCSVLKVRPRDALYVDDTADGTSAALRAGMIAVGFGASTGYNSEDRLRAVAPIIIYSLSQLMGVIKIINMGGYGL